ncbi:MAG: superoxide dismutase [Candidatus Aphodosoma sp.]
MAKFTLPALIYAYTALAPVISKETLEYHHDKHHNAYVTNLNRLIDGTDFENKTLEEIMLSATGGIYNNAAQVWNHTFYFAQFGTKTPVKGALADKITAQWGSIDAFRAEFNNAAATLFGSGWAWLSVDKDGRLVISQEQNAGCPLTKGLTPLMTFDVWEHAYYIDYRNRRPDYIAALWEILDWNVIEARYAAAR